ncbi:restriction endonuclease subunit S [Helicobacter pylori]|uniref:Type I restriction endonuclease n=1 Tax=Helicobacter pylori TaxID=210 RepID=A0AB36S1H1_HELPX|nr:restriction endonuclease subunit S [Helicobacter pylori]PDW60011.1 type I restriction endonuclease [Helicobacter pylori]PDX37826.1 type I restriction endonuclease [Helicobacter pylori]PDX38489.1 type I restriction endonuclease [Helicobacter pylori]
MIGPLSSQLNAIKWGEFRLGDLFEKIIIKPLPYQTAQLPKEKTPTHELPALTAGILNQGLNNFVPKENATILKNVISISANGANTGATFYQPHEFCVLQDAYAIEFIGDKKLNDKEYLFFVCAISKVIYNNSKYEWTNKAGWNKVKNDKVILPLKPTAKTQTLEDIDFDFMEKFIAELEQCRLAELEQCRLAELQAYLKATGLENTTLSSDEENALNVFNGNNSGGGNTPCGLTWQSFKLGDLFEIEKTLSFNKDALTQGEDYDYITRTSQNQGVLQTTGFVNAENLNPPFTWSLGLLQMDFFYRKKSWYAGQFMRKITPKAEIKNKINSRTAHYFTTLLNALKRPLLSVLVRDIDKTFREQKIQLPLKPTANTQTLEDIDFNFMRTLINALMKQTIQGVVQYCGAKIQAAKEVINQETPVQKDSLF